ncbi:hypothetical protein F4555_000364 [Mobiluncus mulieris]|uniref:Uncharacterized protein n=1 Tax=Mobiluncus mulieris TaxID=2052 RepID=A0A8G2HRK3_9ACTO|nr:hypothetical protein [Mobiluncus mulieris]MBB5845568.1 hypothetical protein [Mobiluncus mulieris]STO15764.1 Uncharacterised protein [Mobiluncus mulieris]
MTVGENEPNREFTTFFVSYHHDDNDYLNGAITDLVRDIIKNLE